MNDAGNSFWGDLRTTFLRGVVVIIPLALTYWFFVSLWNGIDGILSPVLEELIGRRVPGLGFVSMMLIILIVGVLSRNLVGKVLFNTFENLLKQIPLVRSVYGAIKDLVGAFAIGGKGKTFREVVLIEYPRPGLYTLAFVTNEMVYTTADNRTKELINVYIPNPPNPTSGVLILVPKEQAMHLNLTIEEGLKLVLSGGIVTPERFEQWKE